MAVPKLKLSKKYAGKDARTTFVKLGKTYNLASLGEEEKYALLKALDIATAADVFENGAEVIEAEQKAAKKSKPSREEKE